MSVYLENAEVTERDVKMRLPFQFGNTQVWGAPEAHIEVTARIDGKSWQGRAAQLMVPRWFDKRTDLSNEDTIDELRRVVATTVDALPGRSGPALAVSRELRQDVGAALSDVPALACGFGPALVEMAMIDAICAAKGLAFWQAAASDVFGLADGVAPEKRDGLRATLSAISAPSRMQLRHTVGFDAPLTEDEIGPDAPRDGLPVALSEVVSHHGIRAFKIKLKGDPDADLARLRAIETVIGGLSDLTVTLDANEQYDRAAFDTFLDGFGRDPAVASIRAATRFVEQPFPRDTALSAPVSADLPLVIDESDDTEDAFSRALDLGWSGTSIKSCKGVLRALLNRNIANESGALLSGEDLTCQPGLCWQQDMAMMSACGVRDVERNGHHFAGGMQGATEDERAARVAAHPDLYAQVDGRVTLRIENGGVGLASLGQPGYANVFR